METDLTIIVGSALKKEQRYECDSHILASYSDYVKAALTNFKEGTTRVLNFSDTEPTVWEEAMNSLKPFGSVDMTIKSIEKVLPFFVQYQFSSAISGCDRILAGLLDQKGYGQDFIHDGMVDTRFDGDDVVLAAKLGLKFAVSLPQSSDLAIDFAHEFVKWKFYSDYYTMKFSDADFFLQFLDYKQHRKTMKYIAACVLKYREEEEGSSKSVEEIAEDLTKAEVLSLFKDEMFSTDYLNYHDRWWEEEED